MKENQKDLLMLCIATFGITYGHLWGIIFPYYASYCYMKDNTIKVDQIYGQLFASASIPYLFKIFGIYLMYLFFSLIEISMGLFSVYYIQPKEVCVVLFFKGLLFQAVQTAGNIILTEKFEGGILKGKYLNTSRLCFSFLWLFFAQIIINPDNLPQDLKSINGEFFFRENVAKNFAFYTLSYSISSSIFLLMPFFFITNPQNFQNNFIRFIKYIFGKGEFEFNIEDQNLNISHLSDSQIYIEQKEKNLSIEKSINQSLSIQQENLLENNKNNKISNKIVNCVGLIVMLNLCITQYTAFSYKYISLVLQFKDVYITLTYFLSNLFYISSNYIVTYLWNKYGFDTSLLLLNLINGFNLIGILFSKNFFIFQVLFARAGFGWLLLLQDLFCYSMFDAFEAMKKTKTMIFYAFLGDLIQVLLNFAIFEENNYKLIFFALFLLNLTSFTIHWKLLYKKIIKQIYQFQNIFLIIIQLKFT